MRNETVSGIEGEGRARAARHSHGFRGGELRRERNPSRPRRPESLNRIVERNGGKSSRQTRRVRWSHHFGQAFTGPLVDAGVRLSMDGKARALDNVFVELWPSVKYEQVYLNDYKSVWVARHRLERFP